MPAPGLALATAPARPFACRPAHPGPAAGGRGPAVAGCAPLTRSRWDVLRAGRAPRVWAARARLGGGSGGGGGTRHLPRRERDSPGAGRTLLPYAPRGRRGLAAPSSWSRDPRAWPCLAPRHGPPETYRAGLQSPPCRQGPRTASPRAQGLRSGAGAARRERADWSAASLPRAETSCPSSRLCTSASEGICYSIVQ